MATFPTTPVLQLPFVHKAKANNCTVKMDAGQQFSYYYDATPLRRWELEYPVLTDDQVATLRAFFDGQGAGWASFSFTDPDTETTHTCLFDGDFEVTYTGPNTRKVRFAITETR